MFAIAILSFIYQKFISIYSFIYRWPFFLCVWNVFWNVWNVLYACILQELMLAFFFAGIRHQCHLLWQHIPHNLPKIQQILWPTGKHTTYHVVWLAFVSHLQSLLRFKHVNNGKVLNMYIFLCLFPASMPVLMFCTPRCLDESMCVFVIGLGVG